MIALVVLVVVVVTMLRVRARRRAMTADVMTDVVGTIPLYRGSRWKVGDKHWL